MEQWQQQIQNTVANMEKKLDQLYSAVVGNELTKEGGFNQFFEDHEKRIKNLERREIESNDFNKKILVIWVTVCTVAGVVYALVDLYLKSKR